MSMKYTFAQSVVRLGAVILAIRGAWALSDDIPKWIEKWNKEDNNHQEKSI